MKNKHAASGIGSLLVACGLALSSGQSLAGPPATTAPSDPFAAFPIVPSQDLSTMRGASGDLTIVSSNQDFKSTVQDSQFNAGTITTGTATVGERAFAGFSGVGVSVLNTGNGNAITTGVNLTVNLH